MLKKVGIVTAIAALLVLVFWSISTKGDVSAGGDVSDNDTENTTTSETSVKSESADVSGNDTDTGSTPTNTINQDETILVIQAPGTIETMITESLDDTLAEEENIIICAVADTVAEVPIVSGQAVLAMNQSGATVHQGDVTEAELKELQEKLNYKNSVDTSQLSAWDFYRMNSLTSYDIPEDVTEIGRFAFARSGLREIVIPEGVTDIKYAAFYHCDHLEKVTIPSTVTNIEMHAFSHTPWLRDFYENSEEDFLIVGDGILLAYKGNETDVEIPKQVKVIAENAFKRPY